MMQADEGAALMMPTGHRRRDASGDRDGTARYHHDWVDTMVEVARNCNKLFSKNTCGVCSIYVEKQLEFERRQEGNLNRNFVMTPGSESMVGATAASGFGPIGCGLDAGAGSSLEVELYRQFLFDEDSVVEEASRRGCDDDGDRHLDHPLSGSSSALLAVQGAPPSQVLVMGGGEDDEVHTVTTQRTN